MTTINFSGIGTGMDIRGLVEQLVAAERAPAENRINRAAAQVNAQLSALGQVRGVFGNLQTALGRLSTSSDTPAHRATVPEGAGFTATTGSSAVAGRYSIEVAALAQSHKLASDVYAADAAVGTGRLTIDVGDRTHTVEIAADSTLSDVARAINASAGGRGVTASVINIDGGQRLVLSATDAGSDNAIRVRAEGGDGGLAALAYDPDAGVNGLDEVNAATDARMLIDGFERSAGSNTITDLVPGLTLNLTKAQPGETFDIRIEQDHSAVLSQMQAFVTAYNNANTTLRSVSAYNAQTQTASALTGDAMVRGMQQQMRGMLSQHADTLSTLGLSISTNGALSLDTGTFNTAMAEDPTLVAGVFGKSGSIAADLDGMLKGALDSSSGTLTNRTNSLNRQIGSLSDQLDALDRRMESVSDRYLAQFIAMDTMVAQMNSTSSYLSQQLESLQRQLNR
ncbi:flagellar filament capping protein FliD [Luteimonas abyssi]|uniref:flagellar filament capping protein FliD n=1 Tax=Luteimonas abyssi TaxID=1247514 RepID=UPI000737B058|nr:flagellar filament capping protein FliD [Luteimonas abyssi]